MGQLHDTIVIVCPGHTFIQYLIDLSKSGHHNPVTGYIRWTLKPTLIFYGGTISSFTEMVYPWCLTHVAVIQEEYRLQGNLL